MWVSDLYYGYSKVHRLQMNIYIPYNIGNWSGKDSDVKLNIVYFQQHRASVFILGSCVPQTKPEARLACPPYWLSTRGQGAGLEQNRACRVADIKTTCNSRCKSYHLINPHQALSVSIEGENLKEANGMLHVPWEISRAKSNRCLVVDSPEGSPVPEKDQFISL